MATSLISYFKPRKNWFKMALFLKNNLTERGIVSSKYPNNIHGELLMPYH